MSNLLSIVSRHLIRIRDSKGGDQKLSDLLTVKAIARDSANMTVLEPLWSVLWYIFVAAMDISPIVMFFWKFFWSLICSLKKLEPDCIIRFTVGAILGIVRLYFWKDENWSLGIVDFIWHIFT